MTGQRNEGEITLARDPAGDDWHLDKRIPVALIMALLIQAGAGLWWAASINARVDVLERALITGAQDHESIIRMEATLGTIRDQLSDINDNGRQQQRR